MNFTNNVPCHTMKPLERKLFKMMIRRIDYNSVKENSGVVEFIMPSNKIIEEFASEYGVPEKMALNYLEKWEKNGIYEPLNYLGHLQYGHFIKMNALCGLFDEDALVYQSKRTKYLHYAAAVPERVKRQYLRAVGNASINKH